MQFPADLFQSTVVEMGSKYSAHAAAFAGFANGKSG
jgi:hypothetical protein